MVLVHITLLLYFVAFDIQTTFTVNKAYKLVPTIVCFLSKEVFIYLCDSR